MGKGFISLQRIINPSSDLQEKRVRQAVEHPDKLVLQLLTLVEGFLFSENVFIAVVSWI